MKGMKMHRNLRQERWLGGQEHMPTFNFGKTSIHIKYKCFLLKRMMLTEGDYMICGEAKCLTTIKGPKAKCYYQDREAPSRDVESAGFSDLCRSSHFPGLSRNTGKVQ